MNKRVYVTGLLILQCYSIITLEQIGMEKIFGPCTSYEKSHVWYQYYEGNKSTIMFMNISGSSVDTTNFIMYLEPFDNYTTVQSKVCLYNVQNIIQDNIIMLSPGNDELLTNATTKIYSDTRYTAIKCDKYKNDKDVVVNVNMGMVMDKSTQIATFEGSQVRKKFDRSYDKAVVYCLYYVRSSNNKVINITRYVTKTRLLYDEYDDTYNSSDPEGLYNEINGQQIYVIAFGIITIVALLTIIGIFCRNRCRKKIENDENRVSYVELDVPDQVINLKTKKEESPYAQIIGEMKHPKLENKPKP